MTPITYKPNPDCQGGMEVHRYGKYVSLKEYKSVKDELERFRKAGNAMDNAISEIDPQRLERHRFMRMTDAEYMAVMLWRTTKDPSYNRA